MQEAGLQAIFEDPAAGDDADEIALVVDDGDKILVGSHGDQILHARVDPHGLHGAAVLDLGDGMLLGLAQVHHAQALDRPQQIALGDDAAVFAALIDHGQRRVAGMLHPLHGLPQGIPGFDIGAHRLRRQKKQNVHASASLLIGIS